MAALLRRKGEPAPVYGEYNSSDSQAPSNRTWFYDCIGDLG